MESQFTLDSFYVASKIIVFHFNKLELLRSLCIHREVSRFVIREDSVVTPGVEGVQGCLFNEPGGVPAEKFLPSDLGIRPGQTVFNAQLVIRSLRILHIVSLGKL